MKDLKWVIFVVAGVMLMVTPLLGESATPTSEKVELNVYCGPLVYSSHVLSVGLSEIVKKYSKRIIINPVETKSNTQSFVEWKSLPPDKQKYAMGVVYPLTVYKARDGHPPFNEPWDNPRLLALVGHMGSPLWTLDPNIKSGFDLVGKRVSFFPRGSDALWATVRIAKHAWGLTEDKYRPRPLGGGATIDALLDGTLDAGWGGSVEKGLTGGWEEWLPNPASERLLSSAKTYVIDIPREGFIKAAAETGYPIDMMYIRHEAATFGKSKLPRFASVNCANSWWVSKDLPDDVVVELLTIMYEHANEFVNYHASGAHITKANLSTTGARKSDYHAAAVKFFESKGNKFYVDLFPSEK